MNECLAVAQTGQECAGILAGLLHAPATHSSPYQSAAVWHRSRGRKGKRSCQSRNIKAKHSKDSAATLQVNNRAMHADWVHCPLLLARTCGILTVEALSQHELAQQTTVSPAAASCHAPPIRSIHCCAPAASAAAACMQRRPFPCPWWTVWLSGRVCGTAWGCLRSQQPGGPPH